MVFFTWTGSGDGSGGNGEAEVSCGLGIAGDLAGVSGCRDPGTPTVGDDVDASLDAFRQGDVGPGTLDALGRFAIL